MLGLIIQFVSVALGYFGGQNAFNIEYSLCLIRFRSGEVCCDVTYEVFLNILTYATTIDSD